MLWRQRCDDFRVPDPPKRDGTSKLSGRIKQGRPASTAVWPPGVAQSVHVTVDADEDRTGLQMHPRDATICLRPLDDPERGLRGIENPLDTAGEETNPELVRAIKRLRHGNRKKWLSLRAISDRLAEMGYVTSKDTTFSASQVKRLLEA